MKDPYENVWGDIKNAFNSYSKMILWIAERTLSVKDYKEFLDEFCQKPDKSQKDKKHID